MAKKRDYKAEYQRRIESGLKRGLSRSQSRGHAKAGELKATDIRKPVYEKRLEEGLKEIRKGNSLSRSAQSVGVSPKTLRKYIQKTGVAYKERNRWKIGSDTRPRDLLIYSQGQARKITSNDYEAARLIGSYMSAVKRFLESNDPKYLKPFEGKIVKDSKGKKYVLETRPNTLHRLANSTTETFEEVYRVVF